MEKKTNTFYGLTFPADFPLNQKDCYQLAKYILLNRHISIQKIRDIINNFDLWMKVRLILEQLHCEIIDINISEADTTDTQFKEKIISYLSEIHEELSYIFHFEEEFAYNIFYQRLFKWIIEFSFPLWPELLSIADSIDVKHETFFRVVYEMLLNPSMPEKKVLDFLMKYQNYLSEQQVNEILDLYLGKHFIS